MCLSELGKFEEAYELRSKVTKIYQQSCEENHPSFGFNLNAHGWLFINKKEYKKSLYYFNRALSIFKISKGPRSVSTCFPLIGMGQCFLKLKQFKKAKEAFKAALEIGLDRFGENTRMVAEAYNGLGETYIEIGNVKKGLRYFARQLNSGKRVFKNCPTMIKILENYLTALDKALKIEGNTQTVLDAAIAAHQVSEELFGKDHSLSQSFNDFIKNLEEKTKKSIQSQRLALKTYPCLESSINSLSTLPFY